ncbi:MAG: hypothetical protein Q9221_008832 [Calogaya cf. arnoldii]
MKATAVPPSAKLRPSPKSRSPRGPMSFYFMLGPTTYSLTRRKSRMMAPPRVAAGHADIAVVDFTAIGAHAELADGIHPNDGTYKRMGDIWFTAIEDAASKGWIKAPFGPDPPRVSGSSGSKQECLAGLFLFQPDGGKLEASGVGHNGNHRFVSNWAPSLEIAAGFGLNYSGIRLADLDGDGRADYLWVDPTTGALRASLNRIDIIDADWLPVNGGEDIVAGGGEGAGVHFADINADGKADYLFVLNDGAVDVWVNGGPTRIPEATQDTVVFAEINGDNRTGYVIKGSAGSLSAFLNIGTAGSETYKLVPVGQVAGDLGNGDVFLADLDGDSRADYMTWDSEGGLSGFLNILSKSEGQPNWIPQGGYKSIAGGTGDPSTHLQLADMDRDGKAVSITQTPLLSSQTLMVPAFTKDYYVINPETGDIRVLYSRGTVYLNAGPAPSGGWSWLPQNNMKPIAGGVGTKRHRIRLADINGDFRWLR